MMLVAKALRGVPVVSVLALLGACAASAPSVVTLPDGSVAYRIDCGGSAVGLNYCFEQAGKSCGAEGYSIVSPDGRVLSTSEVAAADPESLTVAFSTDTNVIYVKCGQPE